MNAFKRNLFWKLSTWKNFRLREIYCRDYWWDFLKTWRTSKFYKFFLRRASCNFNARLHFTELQDHLNNICRTWYKIYSRKGKSRAEDWFACIRLGIYTQVVSVDAELLIQKEKNIRNIFRHVYLFSISPISVKKKIRKNNDNSKDSFSTVVTVALTSRISLPYRVL